MHLKSKTLAMDRGGFLLVSRTPLDVWDVGDDLLSHLSSDFRLLNASLAKL